MSLWTRLKNWFFEPSPTLMDQFHLALLNDPDPVVETKAKKPKTKKTKNNK